MDAWQDWIVWVAVAGALVVVARHGWRHWRSACAGCNGCRR
jgi:hypothetical protein